MNFQQTPSLGLVIIQAMAYRSGSSKVFFSLYHSYFAHTYIWSFLQFRLYLSLHQNRPNSQVFPPTAPHWQTPPVLSSLQPRRAPGEEPLPIASQEQQGKSLLLFLLTQRRQEAESCQPTERASPQTEAPCVQVRVHRAPKSVFSALVNNGYSPNTLSILT